MIPANCFISYSWDSLDHKKWILNFAEELNKNGVLVHLDQWDIKPGMDLTRYMESRIRESSFVLLICTPNFANKANIGAGGVGYEKSIVTGEIFQSAPIETKFIPVLRSGSPSESIPSYLKSRAFVDTRDDAKFLDALEELLRHIHNAPSVTRPPLGQKPIFDIGKNAENTQRTSSVRVPAEKPNQSRFDISQFKELMDYGQSYSGLAMPKREALEWAEAHVSSNFELSKFKEIMDYAQSYSGLGMPRREAIDWVEARISENPPFELGKFKEIMDYAQSYSGGGMSRKEAIEWALSKTSKS